LEDNDFFEKFYLDSISCFCSNSTRQRLTCRPTQ